MTRVATALLAVLLAVTWTDAATPTCAITGQVLNIDGTIYANQNVYFQSGIVQNASGVVIPSGQQVSVKTDANGFLPTSGGCRPVGTQFCPPQGSIFFAQIGNGPGATTKMQAPLSTSADLNTLILANSDPPSLITNILSGNNNCSIANPAPGTFGQATVTCSAGGGTPGALVASNNLSDVGSTTTSWKNLNAGQAQVCSTTGTTSGSAVCDQVSTGLTKTTTCFLNAYYNSTAVAQQCVLSANGGMAFANTGNIISNVSPFAATLSGSPPNTINLPINMQAAETGQLIVGGQ